MFTIAADPSDLETITSSVSTTTSDVAWAAGVCLVGALSLAMIGFFVILMTIHDHKHRIEVLGQFVAMIRAILHRTTKDSQSEDGKPAVSPPGASPP